jgi:hypothetical protein
MLSKLFGTSSKAGTEALNELGEEERFYGFDNLGNTCYFNSVVEALFALKPFRDCCRAYTYPQSSALHFIQKNGIDPSLLVTPESSLSTPTDTTPWTPDLLASPQPSPQASVKVGFELLTR